MMREQRGYVFHRYHSWFVRHADDVMQPDGSIKRKLVCKKLSVPYEGKPTEKPVAATARQHRELLPFIQEILNPLNCGTLNPASTQTVSSFVDKIYVPEYVEKKLRPATRRQYVGVWKRYLKPRIDKSDLALRDFRTVHGERLLAQIREQAQLGRSELRHCKCFLSGAFKQAKRLGILDGLNPMQDTSIPKTPEPEETYAYTLDEIKSMLAQLRQPAWTVMLCAALTGLRKSELRGLTWANFSGRELTVTRSVWNATVNKPKTRKSSAPVPVVKQLADALEAHKLRAGILAQDTLPIFQAGNGSPLNLDNLVRRVIVPSLSICAVCKKREDEHKPEGHIFQRDKSVPEWHGWHAFRRGLATNLHELGVDDKTIQAILRHSNIALTQNIYIKSVNQSQVNAMDSLSEKLGTCNVLATFGSGKAN